MNAFGYLWEWVEEWARKTRGVGRRSGEMLRRLAGQYKVPDREQSGSVHISRHPRWLEAIAAGSGKLGRWTRLAQESSTHNYSSSGILHDSIHDGIVAPLSPSRDALLQMHPQPCTFVSSSMGDIFPGGIPSRAQSSPLHSSMDKNFPRRHPLTPRMPPRF
jgi:hypothetical protein